MEDLDPGDDSSAARAGVRWWTRPRARLAAELACLGLAAAGLIAWQTNVFSSASGSGNHGDGARVCVPGNLPTPASADLAGLRELRARLLVLMGPLGRPRYAWGVVDAQEMWSDAIPQRIASARLSNGRWPAGYEMRAIAGNGDDLRVGVVAFDTAAQARAFFLQAASASCHRAGTAALAPLPVGARSLAWLNPDRVIEQDTFLLVGRRVFRVGVVVPQRPGQAPAIVAAPSVVSPAGRLACVLLGPSCYGGRHPHARRSRAGGSGGVRV